MLPDADSQKRRVQREERSSASTSRRPVGSRAPRLPCTPAAAHTAATSSHPCIASVRRLGRATAPSCRPWYTYRRLPSSDTYTRLGVLGVPAFKQNLPTHNKLTVNRCRSAASTVVRHLNSERESNVNKQRTKGLPPKKHAQEHIGKMKSLRWVQSSSALHCQRGHILNRDLRMRTRLRMRIRMQNG